MSIQEEREQLFLELINRARMDPAGEAARYKLANLSTGTGTTITTDAKQVLAYNGLLFNSATNHNLWMITNDLFQHEGPDNNEPADRMVNAGYGQKVTADSYTFYGGENLGYSGTTGTVNGNEEVLNIHKNLFLSAGHRWNMLYENYEEAGISAAVALDYIGYNSMVSTHNFGGKLTPAIYVTGVSYNDLDNNDFYSVGESNAGRTVQIYADSSLLGSTTTANAGGYALSTIAVGEIEIVFSNGGLTNDQGALFVRSSTDDQNVKFDLTNGNTIETNVTATLTRNAVNLTLLSINDVNGIGNSFANTILGNKANNILDGADGNDILNGGAGSDFLIGGNGNDTLIGGVGLDTAEFSDDLANYQITSSSPSVFSFLGADGFTDTATGIEKFIFNDATYTSTQLQSLATAAKPLVSVTPAGLSVNEGNSGQTVFSFTVSLDKAALAPQSVNYTVTGAGPNAADSADFFGALTGSLSFAAGETSKTVQVVVAGDTIIEANETFSFTLSTPSSGLELGGDSVTATIVTDDLVRHVSASAPMTGRSEGASGTATHIFVVTLDGASSSDQSVNWSVTGAGAQPTDAADFTGNLSGTLVFAAGETMKLVNVAVLGDKNIEANETFDFTLLSPTSGLVLANSSVTATILNDDRDQNDMAYVYSGPNGLSSAPGGYGGSGPMVGHGPDLPMVTHGSNDWYGSSIGAHSAESHLF